MSGTLGIAFHIGIALHMSTFEHSLTVTLARAAMSKAEHVVFSKLPSHRAACHRHDMCCMCTRRCMHMLAIAMFLVTIIGLRFYASVRVQSLVAVAQGRHRQCQDLHRNV